MFLGPCQRKNKHAPKNTNSVLKREGQIMFDICVTSVFQVDQFFNDVPSHCF